MKPASFEVRQIALADITRDDRLQMRAEPLDNAIVLDYADNLDSLPASIVYLDSDGRFWLSDGFYRYHAHVDRKRKTMPCIVLEGDRRDALLNAMGANHHHGLRRTNETKRRAVLTAIEDPEWAKMSDRWIADACKVSHPFVAAIRQSIANSSTQTHAPQEEGEVETVTTSKTRTGADGKSYPAPGSDAIKLCQRCKRVGAVKDCPACAELNKPPPKQPLRHTLKSEALLDANDEPVPDLLRDVFGDPWLRLLMQKADEAIDLINFDATLRQIKGKSLPYAKWLQTALAMERLAKVHDALTEYRDTIEAGIPFALCPTCKGKKGYCGDCRRSGYVPIFRDQELKDSE